MQPYNLRFTRGPTLKFTGELLASDEWEARSGRIVLIEFYQTQGGALIGVRRSKLDYEDNWSESEAIVVEPRDDVQAQRFELLGFFNFEVRAKKMAKGLRWNLTREVA